MPLRSDLFQAIVFFFFFFCCLCLRTSAVCTACIDLLKDVGMIHGRLPGSNQVSVAEKGNRIREGNSKVHETMKNVCIPGMSKSIRGY